jgi:hypothetical protein
VLAGRADGLSLSFFPFFSFWQASRNQELSRSQELKQQLKATKDILGSSQRVQEDYHNEVSTLSSTAQAVIDENNRLRDQLRDKAHSLDESRVQLSHTLRCATQHSARSAIRHSHTPVSAAAGKSARWTSLSMPATMQTHA